MADDESKKKTKPDDEADEDADDESEGGLEDEAEGDLEDEAEGDSEDEAEGDSEDEAEGDSEDEAEGNSEDEAEGHSDDEAESDSEDLKESSEEEPREPSSWDEKMRLAVQLWEAGNNAQLQEVLSELEKAPKEETAVHTLVSEYRRRLKPDPVAIGLWVLTLFVFCLLTYLFVIR